MSTVRIVAELVLKPGMKEELMPIFTNLVAGSRAEAGNIEYELTESLKNPDHLFVIETWKNMEAIEFHGTTPHYLAFRSAIDGKTEKRVAVQLKHLL